MLFISMADTACPGHVVIPPPSRSFRSTIPKRMGKIQNLFFFRYVRLFRGSCEIGISNGVQLNRHDPFVIYVSETESFDEPMIFPQTRCDASDSSAGNVLTKCRIDQFSSSKKPFYCHAVVSVQHQ